VVLALISVACAGDALDPQTGLPSAPSGQTPVVRDLNVSRVRAFIRDGRLQAFVEGELGDGCNALQGITQRRSNNSVDIHVTYRRQGEVCTMIMQYVNEWVALDGPFGPGAYTVRANDRAVEFRLVMDGSGLRIEPDPGPLPRPPYLPGEAETPR
jgi:hypothetical protein